MGVLERLEQVTDQVTEIMDHSYATMIFGAPQPATSPEAYVKLGEYIDEFKPMGEPGSELELNELKILLVSTKPYRDHESVRAQRAALKAKFEVIMKAYKEKNK